MNKIQIFRKNISVNRLAIILFVAIIPLIFTSCGDVLGMKKVLHFLPDTIDGFGSFFKSFLIIAIAQFFVAWFISLLIGYRAANLISGVILFIVILVNKDYGFWMILLLFSTSTIIGWVFAFLFFLFSSASKNNDNY